MPAAFREIGDLAHGPGRENINLQRGDVLLPAQLRIRDPRLARNVETAEKLRRINSQDDRKLHRIVGESLPALVESAEPLDRKVIRLRRIADAAAKVIAPFTPCTKGCSACCHNTAIISELDAMQIASPTGAPLANPP